MSITKQDVMNFLEHGGFIEKIVDSEGKSGFYCSAKTCRKTLTSDFSNFGIPTSRHSLREILRKHGTRPTKPDGEWGDAPSVTTRCLICAYRAYRTLYHRRNNTYPEADVPDDFNTNSPVPEVKVKSPQKAKAASPQKAPPRQDTPLEQLRSKLYIKMASLLNEDRYSRGILMRWMPGITSFTEKDFGVLITPSGLAEIYPVVWYLPTQRSWDTFAATNPKILVDHGEDIAWAHYLKLDDSDPRYLVNVVNNGQSQIRVRDRDLKVIESRRFELLIKIGSGLHLLNLNIQMIDEVLIPDALRAGGADNFKEKRDEIIGAAIETMEDMGCLHWASLWKLVLKSTRFLQDPDEFPNHPIFIVPEEAELQRVLAKYIKKGVLDANPGPTQIGWEIFFCSFGTLSVEGKFISVKGHEFPATPETIDKRQILERDPFTMNKVKVQVIKLNGLLSVEELSAKVRK